MGANLQTEPASQALNLEKMVGWRPLLLGQRPAAGFASGVGLTEVPRRNRAEADGGAGDEGGWQTVVAPPVTARGKQSIGGFKTMDHV